MTPEAFEQIVIKNQSFDKFRVSFADLSDSERKKLSRCAQALYRQVKAATESAWSKKELKHSKDLSENVRMLTKKIEKACGLKKHIHGGATYK